MKVEITAIADHALLVQFSKELSDEAHDLVLALDAALADAPPPGLIEVVPALVNLLVDFDPLVSDHKLIEADIRAKLKACPPLPDKARHTEFRSVMKHRFAPISPP